MDKKKLERLFNRKVYREIKAADRQEMQEFIEKIYEVGFKDGAETAPEIKPIDKTAVYEALIRLKGIGEKKAEIIMQEITPLIDCVSK